MATASWNGVTLAKSESVQVVEGNLYFPPDALNREHFTESDTRSTCPWKGVASYYHVEVEGSQNRDAAWVYLEPKPEAENIRAHVAFWRGIEVKG